MGTRIAAVTALILGFTALSAGGGSNALAASAQQKKPAQKQAQKQIGVGDTAPKVRVREFVKGKPITGFAKGKVYVVEFWATWCGPCLTSIPHLTELQKKYKNDVTFVGVSVWEEDQAGVKPFVAKMGDKMGYTVAVDAVPAGGTGNDGAMAKAWMQAAGQKGIPSAFIIDRNSKIAWIGHPMGMDKPLEEIVAGTFDTAAYAAKRKKEQEEQRRMMGLQTELRKAQQSGDPKQMIAVLDSAFAKDAALEKMLGLLKFQTLASSGATNQAQEYGSRLVGVVLKDDAMGLNNFAWSLVAPEAPPVAANYVKLALQAAESADALKEGKDGAIADTLAKTYFDTGSPNKAFETQERAVRLAKGTPMENDKEMLARLEQYRKAAGK